MNILDVLEACYSWLSNFIIPTPFGNINLWTLLLSEAVICGVFAIIQGFTGE